MCVCVINLHTLMCICWFLYHICLLHGYGWFKILYRSLGKYFLFCQRVTQNEVKIKVKSTVEQATKTQRGVEVYLYFYFNLGARWWWVVNSTPRPLYPRERPLYPLYRRLGGPQSRSGQVRKISPPSGFDPRTVQPKASRYTDWAIQAPIYIHI